MVFLAMGKIFGSFVRDMTVHAQCRDANVTTTDIKARRSRRSSATLELEAASGAP
jgi:hypothetical protein